ncbi:MAG: 4Fe-4S binding protein [Hyphomicrobiales bacterium]|nr:4Fe-4S binding protein [Hyphomicrobiales bacterium]
MKQVSRTCLLCDCEKTMPLDAAKVSAALGQDIGPIHTQLCRSQVDRYEKALSGESDLIVACTQETPLFQEIAQEHGRNAPVRFVNIRENAGWSADVAKASPKIAALLAAAAYEPRPVQLKSVISDGLCLVYGSGDQALEAAKILSARLSVTLMLSDDEPFAPPAEGEIPIYRGDIAKLEGSFGGFTLRVNNYAPLMPSSRSQPQFVMARDGAQSTCSLILDLSGKTPLVTGHQHRDGYMRADPGNPAAVLRSAIALSEMAGEFEKPLYVELKTDKCAHARSRIVGCSKCLDVCPAGAITEMGDVVSIDSGICGGCGSCHAVCPTDAISYRYPQREDMLAHTQLMLQTYTEAGGKEPVLLLHNLTSGFEMISAMARFGRGLPANVLPVSFHSVTTPGHVELAGFLASGAQRVFILTDPKRRDEIDGLKAEIALADRILAGLGYGADGRIQLVDESDPDRVEEAVWQSAPAGMLADGGFAPVGSKRDIARVVFAKLHERAPQQPDVIELSEKSPYGALKIDPAACTLCMACTSACPTGAIMDTPGEPKLRFTENSCVQCGLCVKTCPESALALEPRLNFTSAAMQPVTLYEEAPFECVSCSKPFATKSTIERIKGQLAGKHAMFADTARSRMIEMCEDCRVEAMANSKDDPFAIGSRPKVRTTEDYLAMRDGKPTADDFLIDD